MEQDQYSNTNTSLFQMNLDAQNSYNLRSAASWGKVMGVAGMILGTIFVLLSAIAIGKLSSYGGYSYRKGGIGDMFGSSLAATKLGLWILIITGIIFVLGGIFSFNFGNKISAALRSNDQHGLNAGFSALRNYYALRSIVLILVLLLMLVSLSNSI